VIGSKINLNNTEKKKTIINKIIKKKNEKNKPESILIIKQSNANLIEGKS
jgi:hypothetical protein